MNSLLSFLLKRSSCRNFDKNFALSEETLNNIIKVAKQAPNWSNGQAYSIIVLKGEDKINFIRELRSAPGYCEFYAGQFDIIEHASAYLVFCADLFRASIIVGDEFDICNNIEPVIIATGDTAIALKAAEGAVYASGLSSVVQGVIRFFGNTICSSLNLPKYTFPLYGLAIGKPDSDIDTVKPRLSNSITVFEGKYKVEETLNEELHRYDQELSERLMVLFGDGRSWYETTKKFYQEKQYPEDETRTMLIRQGLIK